MDNHADLEIEIESRGDQENAYQIDLRFSESDADTTHTPPGGPFALTIDRQALLSREMDTAAYGYLLSEMLFAPEAVKIAFTRARENVAARNTRLRIRLRIRYSARELHHLRWETLSDPLDVNKTLVTNESILFSRFVDSTDFRRADLRPRQELRALIVVANPGNLKDYGLAAIDVEGEVSRAQAALAGIIPDTVLAGSGAATLEKIFAELGQGYDILYLVAHGTFHQGNASIFLENDEGQIDRVHGDDLVNRFADMWQRPRLVVLASCESAGRGRTVQEVADPLAALGPQLAREGIPAVLAMQGTVSMATIEKFMPVFFQHLSEREEIDTAMAEARNHVRDQEDWWMPVLYSRLKSGRISWYNSGFADDSGFKWPILVNLLQKQEINKCTPILGSGLSEPLIGTHRELSQDWAKKYGFPLAPQDRDDLPQVAQYLAVSQNRDLILEEYIIYIGDLIRRRHKAYLSPELLAGDFKTMDEDDQLAALNELLTAVWEKHVSLNKNDPYRALARLNFPLYINTGVSNLLAEALVKEGKQPQMAICPWNDAAYEEVREAFNISVEQPLVYHMFGHLSQRDSLVLTEDDYFDYLIGVTNNKKLIPHQIRAAITNQTTLIMGLTFNTWESRILFRMIMNQGGRRRRQRQTHLSAQIAPTKPDVDEPLQARRYLEEYFRNSAVNIFWGKPEDFIRSLREKLDGVI